MIGDGVADTDLLGVMDSSTLNTSAGSDSRATEYKTGIQGVRVEKPFSGENTLDEPVLDTIVGTSMTVDKRP